MNHDTEVLFKVSYKYDNNNNNNNTRVGVRGLVLAVSMEAAKEIVLKKHPDAKILDLYEVGKQEKLFAVHKHVMDLNN